MKTDTALSSAGRLYPAGSTLKNDTFSNRHFYSIFTPPLTMDRQADFRYRSGNLNHTIAWILLTF
ncbi:MAG: hypothetical protein FP813_13790, partial [Desulfurivibrio sp.]|nr:hypothetical protein [Desulfurivibrio sp.]